MKHVHAGSGHARTREDVLAGCVPLRAGTIAVQTGCL